MVRAPLLISEEENTTHRRPFSSSGLDTRLPLGGHDGEEVTVIGVDYGHVRVLGDSKTTVFIVNIDSGWDEWVDGKGSETSPRE